MEFVNMGNVEGDALVLGENSYVTNAEAMKYLKTYFPESSYLLTSWCKLSQHDQNVALVRSTLALERLMYAGAKVNPNQHLSFPRRYQYVVQTEVPKDIKYAQIENAVYIGCNTTESKQDIEDETFYKSLRDKGITSYTMGSLSETFGDSSVLSGTSPTSPEKVLLSSNARALVQKYLTKGANII